MCVFICICVCVCVGKFLEGLFLGRKQMARSYGALIDVGRYEDIVEDISIS